MLQCRVAKCWASSIWRLFLLSMLCASGCFQMLPSYMAVSQRAPKFKPYIDSFGLILGHSSNLQIAQNDTKMLQQILHLQKQNPGGHVRLNHSSPLNWNPSQHTDFKRFKIRIPFWRTQPYDLDEVGRFWRLSCSFTGFTVLKHFRISRPLRRLVSRHNGFSDLPLGPVCMVSIRFPSLPFVSSDTSGINQSITATEWFLQICKLESLSALAPFGLLAAHEIAPEATKQTEK